MSSFRFLRVLKPFSWFCLVGSVSGGDNDYVIYDTSDMLVSADYLASFSVDQQIEAWQFSKSIISKLIDDKVVEPVIEEFDKEEWQAFQGVLEQQQQDREHFGDIGGTEKPRKI